MSLSGTLALLVKRLCCGAEFVELLLPLVHSLSPMTSTDPCWVVK